MQPGIARVQFHAGGLDQQLAAEWHGIPGVHREVHDHLLEVMRIGADRTVDGLERDAHLDVLPHQAREHRPQVLDHAVEIQHARFQDLFAAEGQQLPRQSHGAFPGLGDFFHRAPERIGTFQLG